MLNCPFILATEEKRQHRSQISFFFHSRRDLASNLATKRRQQGAPAGKTYPPPCLPTGSSLLQPPVSFAFPRCPVLIATSRGLNFTLVSRPSRPRSRPPNQTKQAGLFNPPRPTLRCINPQAARCYIFRLTTNSIDPSPLTELRVAPPAKFGNRGRRKCQIHRPPSCHRWYQLQASSRPVRHISVTFWRSRIRIRTDKHTVI